ncbi:hypothetical protein RSOLAG1IB_02868 [Rhizoctonia solani AG-1 IB]|uniref:Uncharacterized protein n=1 Tax=Thanatephorus cucumeris (strain AG1-IB / isolate 7/3/14) TaxID=1108050 RepID=A0A0B7FPI4_THACB|nr:hypothetical protein RSOLAG1IB_02868 [Rhizoctonia solani AG-1 IB]
MHIKSIVTGVLLATGVPIAASLISTRDDDQCRRAQLYGCTGNDFTGNCEKTDLGYTGVCYKTAGLFRDGLASVRSEYSTGAVLFTSGDCTGTPLWVDTEGEPSVNATQYQSYVGIFVPEYS